MKHKKHKKHNYPKTRKPRKETGYSMTYKVLNEIGKDQLFEIWKDNGHRKTSDIVTKMLGVWVTEMVIQYIAQKKFGWVRVVTDKSLPIYKGVLSGKVPASVYKSIIFQ
ncbi:MAG: hypothetical protein NTX65_12410 [Ignavibacteriales bacterium]|nr:hypothetical protein [Ignavibacteriales bacterium]